MTYNVFGGTLNLTQSINHDTLLRAVVFFLQLAIVTPAYHAAEKGSVTVCRLNLLQCVRRLLYKMLSVQVLAVA